MDMGDPVGAELPCFGKHLDVGSKGGDRILKGPFALLMMPKRYITRGNPNPFSFAFFRPVTLGCLGRVTRIPI
jgi:hypothetical protein